MTELQNIQGISKLDVDNIDVIDVKYFKKNKKRKDVLSIILKNAVTDEKFIINIDEPIVPVYIEKPEYRNTHSHHLSSIPIDKCDRIMCKYNNLVYGIANHFGPEAVKYVSERYSSNDYESIKYFLVHKNVFGSDIPIETTYRIMLDKYLKAHRSIKEESIPMPINKGHYDIELDTYGWKGILSKVGLDCKVNAATYYSTKANTSYTFLLVHYDPVMSQDNEYYDKTLEMYQRGWEQQDAFMDDVDEFKQYMKDKYSEAYPDTSYKFYFYEDERQMIIDMFTVIKRDSPDLVGIWNLPFDIPTILDRCKVLDIDSKLLFNDIDDLNDIEPVFIKDRMAKKPSAANDTFITAGTTIWVDNMKIYTNVVYGGSSLRSNKLDYASKRELGTLGAKTDYKKVDKRLTIKNICHLNFKLFVEYNILDVMSMHGIENKFSGIDTFFSMVQSMRIKYSDSTKMSVLLRASQHEFHLDNGEIVGGNINRLINANKEKKKFTGGAVANPDLNNANGVKLYGDRRTNNIFRYVVDNDMGAFYPSSITSHNIDKCTLIFSVRIPTMQYIDNKIPLYTMDTEDIGLEAFDDFSTGDFLSLGTKMLNLPSITDMIEIMGDDL